MDTEMKLDQQVFADDCFNQYYVVRLRECEGQRFGQFIINCLHGDS